MNSELNAKIHKMFEVELQDMEARENVKIGDTVTAFTKILISKKVQKTLTTAERQAQKKAADAGNIVEADKTQPFKGVVISRNGIGKNSKITVRKIGADGIGVEKIIPLYSVVLDKLEVIAPGKPRRSKLYYLRNRLGKQALRVKESKTVAV